MYLLRKTLLKHGLMEEGHSLVDICYTDTLEFDTVNLI